MSGVVECYRRVSNRLWAVESVSNRPVLLSSSARSRAAGSASLWTLTFGHTCGFTPGTGPTFARSTAAIKSSLSPPTWNHTSWHTPKPKTTSDLRRGVVSSSILTLETWTRALVLSHGPKEAVTVKAPHSNPLHNVALSARNRKQDGADSSNPSTDEAFYCKITKEIIGTVASFFSTFTSFSGLHRYIAFNFLFLQVCILYTYFGRCLVRRPEIMSLLWEFDVFLTDGVVMLAAVDGVCVSFSVVLYGC